MEKILDGIHRLLIGLLAVTVILLMVPVSLQIFSRFTEIIPRYMWTEEMSRFLFIWMVMLGASVGVREGLHFDVDVWPNLKPRTALLLKLVSNACIIFFACVVLYWGIEFTQFGWNQTSELADMPMWWIFIAWPLCGFLWLAFLVDSTLRDTRRLTQISNS
jgi:TRAP-type C4-dicarboxylate transport system permease small subunit